MKKLIFVTIILIISIYLAVKAQNGGSFIFFQAPAGKPQVTIDGHTFKVEVAKTDKDKEIGLTKYQSLDQDAGMFFSFGAEGNYSFWMRGMKFPIDIIYIDQGKVVDIKKNLPPADSSTPNIPTYAPSKPADSVLEISSGLSDKYGFKIGDSVQTSGL